MIKPFFRSLISAAVLYVAVGCATNSAENHATNGTTNYATNIADSGAENCTTTSAENSSYVEGSDIVHMIDTRVGSAASDSPDASIFGSGGEVFGNTIPCVTDPNGMTFWTPQTTLSDQKGVSPYYYSDPEWRGFRASHWLEGGATQDYGSFFLVPGCRHVPMDHSLETAMPHYYRYGDYEMAGRSHSAIFRLADCDELELGVFNQYSEGSVSYDPSISAVIAENPVHRIYQGLGQRAGFSGWSFATFNCPVTSAEISEDGRSIKLKFDTTGRTLMVKVGTSFNSAQKAESNLENQIPGWDFDGTCAGCKSLWDDLLSKIEIKGGDSEMAAHFYTSLWRASLLPRTVSDIGEVPDYDDFSMWDTFRALHPLMTILRPSLTGEMAQSLIRKYERGGWLPIMPMWGSYTSAMIGDHVISMLADAYVKGIGGFDVSKAYEAVRKNAFETPDDSLYVDGRGRRALKTYIKYGYLPLEEPVENAFHRREQVSRTLEYSYDDWCASLLAKDFGTQEDYDLLRHRADNWKNVFDPRTGYPQGRHEDGSFLDEDNYLTKTSFITEGTPCHYAWFVPHDVDGLINMLGRNEFEARLDSMFTCRRNWHGNEPCHHIPYLYDWLGRRDKTAHCVEEILRSQYRNTPGGLSGNDDAGQMSAWYVFSCIGFYPVCPGSGEYALGVPAFDRITIHLENGNEFRIVRSGSPYDTCKLNGKKLGRPFLSHEDIVKGGRLRF